MDLTQATEILTNGEMRVEGRLAWGSNYTMLAYACIDDQEVPLVYKPQRGERPLWDFPVGTLCNRERAAYVVAKGCSWDFVPPTVLRDGPYGMGSAQLFIEHDPEEHFFTFQGQAAFDSQLQPIVLFDWMINNADRKGGHVLLDADDRIWAIDHGICFHTEHKLRSVIWEYAGKPISAELLANLTRFEANLTNSPIANELATLLSSEEIDALHRRTSFLLQSTIFPEPGPGRHYPWPPV
ncbi:MAG: SCO1664 family protein [Candidatus Promineifilaceae bacterium]